MIVKYYQDRDGSQPVAEFIDDLPVKAQVLLHNQIERLDLCTTDGPPLPYPYSSQVRGELRELRSHVGTKLYRVLYRRSERFFVLLHIFQKNTQKVPESEISIADARWRDFKGRMDENPRRPPRPIGRDAP
jgi:phage-related protein